jgi:hypothetical protein
MDPSRNTFVLCPRSSVLGCLSWLGQEWDWRLWPTSSELDLSLGIGDTTAKSRRQQEGIQTEVPPHHGAELPKDQGKLPIASPHFSEDPLCCKGSMCHCLLSPLSLAGSRVGLHLRGGKAQTLGIAGAHHQAGRIPQPALPLSQCRLTSHPSHMFLAWGSRLPGWSLGQLGHEGLNADGRQESGFSSKSLLAGFPVALYRQQLTLTSWREFCFSLGHRIKLQRMAT